MSSTGTEGMERSGGGDTTTAQGPASAATAATGAHALTPAPARPAASRTAPTQPSESELHYLCRRCAQQEGAPYHYPFSPWVYCTRCGEPLGLEEQQLALARLRLEGRLDGPRHEDGLSSSSRASASAARPLMPIPEVAHFLSKTVQAVYKMVERGQLPGVVHVGRRIYVRRAELLRCLNEGRVPSPRRSR